MEIDVEIARPRCAAICTTVEEQKMLVLEVPAPVSALAKTSAAILTKASFGDKRFRVVDLDCLSECGMQVDGLTNSLLWDCCARRREGARYMPHSVKLAYQLPSRATAGADTKIINADANAPQTRAPLGCPNNFRMDRLAALSQDGSAY